MSDQLDYPFDEVVDEAARLVMRGFTVFQKFSCQQCRQRLTVDTPNSFHPTGSCEQCGALTDIKARGCNFLLVAPADELGALAPRRKGQG
jgi:hypothetical protein